MRTSIRNIHSRGGLRSLRDRRAFTIIEIMIGVGAMTLLTITTILSAPEIFRRVRVASTLSVLRQCQDLFDGYTGEATFTSLPITEYGAPPGLTAAEATGIRFEQALKATGLMKEYPKFGVGDGTTTATPAGAIDYAYNITTRRFFAPTGANADWSAVGRMEVCASTGAALPAAAAFYADGTVGSQFFIENDTTGIATGQRIGFAVVPQVKQKDAELMSRKINGERYDGEGNPQRRGKLIYPAPDANGFTTIYYYFGTD